MKAPILALLLAAPASAYDMVDFLDPVPVKEAGRLADAAAAPGRLYAVDDKKGALLIVSEADGAVKTVAGSGGQKMSRPAAVVLDSEGAAYVADAGSGRIFVFGPDGDLRTAFGGKGSKPGQLSGPEGVAVGADGRVYAADTGNDRVCVFTGEGLFLYCFGTKGSAAGELDSPSKVAVDAADYVYVIDRGNGRVQKFDPQGKSVREFKMFGEDLVVDGYGFLYMLDPKKGKITELNGEGFVQGGFGSAGSGTKGQFKKPAGIGISADGTLVVADAGNARLQRARVSSKAKTRPLPPNLATKVLVSGPKRSAAYAADVVGAIPGALFAWLPKPGRIVRLDEKGEEAASFGRKSEKGPSGTRGAGGIAVSQALGVYVADAEDDRIQRFDLAGVFQAEFGAAKGLFESKKKEGRVKEPRGLALSEKGVLYVADTGNRRIQAFGKDGDFLFSFGPQIGPYELERPWALAWDEDGFLYVLDRGLKKVFKCEPSGGFAVAWGEEGDGIGQFRDPVAIAYDGRGYVYVLDKGNPRVSVFDRKGRWVTGFLAAGGGERGLKAPEALAVAGKELVVADPAQSRLLAFELKQYLAPPVSVSTQVVDGVVWLKWAAREESHVARYLVYRSSAEGPFAQIGTATETDFEDEDVVPYERYRYRVASEGRTGDVGPGSAPVDVYVAGEFNRPPLEISSITVNDIFSAYYKWYLGNPVGTAVLTNNVNAPFHNVKVSFRLKDFMDFAWEKPIDRVEPRQQIELPLMATLNNRILEVSEDTPIQAEFALTYYEKGKEQTFSRALPLKVYSRNAITWQDPRRIAAFITPKDPPVLDLTRAILLQKPAAPAGSEYLNSNLASAAHVWAALGAAGVRFLPSPNNPFEKVSQDPAFPVDYTQFPRETLRRKSGECDDLVTLLASAFEGATVRAAVLDYPGHLALMVDTGAEDPVEAGLPAEDMIEHEGTWWVPLEATMLGSPFEDAARKALSAYREMAKDGKARIIDLREAWREYAPATMPASSEKTEASGAEAAGKAYAEALEHYLKERYSFLTGTLKGKLASSPQDADLLNQLGVVYFQHGRLEEAEKSFVKALAGDPQNAAAANNLGNLAYGRGSYEEARERYVKASTQDPQDAGIWLNIARAELKLGKKDQARESAKRAVALSSELGGAVKKLFDE